MQNFISKHKKCLLLVIIAILCIFLSCLSTSYDFDFFARIIVGERYIAHGILPFKDFLSYTPTHDWYDHEWGSGVVFYLFLKYLGPIGILLLQAITMFFITFFVIKTQKLQKHSFPTSIIFITLFLCLYTKLNIELVRCQIFSFLFFSIFLYILESNRLNKSKNLIWIIPAISILWNNLHGGVVSGIGLVIMYMIGSIIERKEWKKYLAVIMTSGIGLIINPYGIKYLNFLLSATTMHRKYVVEWWPFYAHRHFMYYLPTSLFLIFSYLCAIINRKNLNITKLIVLTTTLYLGLAHVKLLSLALIAVVSLCYNDIFRLFIKLKRILKPIEKSVILAILILGISIPLFSPTAVRLDGEKYPFYEIEFLKTNNFTGNIVVPFGVGSYASYKLYPNMKIYMDGRYEEVYNNKEFNVLRQFENIETNWDDIITKYPTDVLMVYKNSEIFKFLQKNTDWVLIYKGISCGIFVKKEDKKTKYKVPNPRTDYYRNTMFEHGDFTND